MCLHSLRSYNLFSPGCFGPPGEAQYILGQFDTLRQLGMGLNSQGKSFIGTLLGEMQLNIFLGWLDYHPTQ